MKIKTRILSALLTVFLLLSALATGVAATEPTPAPGKVLFEENFDETVQDRLGWKNDEQGYKGTTHELSVTDTFGESGNKALKLVETASNWCGIEMVPAEKMAGVTKYSISADMMWETAMTFAFRFGDASVSNGDFVGISWDYTLWNVTGGQDSADTNYKNSEKITKNQVIRLVATVDTVAGTVAVSIDGETVTTRNDATKKVGAIYLLVRGLTGYLDNLLVKNDATGEKIYEETFETVRNVYLGKDASYTYLPSAVSLKNGRLEVSRPDSTNKWTSREIVPASAIGDAAQYVISFDLTTEQASGSWTHNILLSWGSGSRNVVGLHSDAQGDYFKQLVSNKETLASGAYGELMNRTFHIQIEVNAETGVSNFWMDGVRTGSLTNSGFQNGGFSFGASYHSTGSLDNLLVTAGTVADLAQVRYIGVQNSTVNMDGTYAIRFVGALGDVVKLEDYTAVGFKVTATYGEDGQKTLDTACRSVYSKLIGSVDGVTEEYSAGSFGAKYLFALVVNGVPTSAGQITFTVTPYYTTADSTVNGTTYTVIYNAGTLVSQTAQ